MSLPAVLLLLALGAGESPAVPPPVDPYLRERVEGLSVLQLRAPGFSGLSAEERRVAWYLTLASHAGEEILYGQRGWRALEVKRLLEGVYLFGLPGDAGAPFTARLVDYLTRFYAHTGNHEAGSGRKFVPAFTFEELKAAAERALAAGAPWEVKDAEALGAWLESLRPTLFEPAFQPVLTARDAAAGDLLAGSASTLYGPGVSEEALRGFQERYALNSRVVRAGDGRLVEEVYRAGTRDGKVRPGLYAEPLGRVIGHLERAAAFAGPAQREVLRRLVRSLRTGEPRDWDAYVIAWLKADPAVDAHFGFLETYLDPRGRKGEWDGYVYFRASEDVKLMRGLAARAGYFEARMPWPEEYKRRGLRVPVARGITVVTSHPRSPVGINLPNEQHLRERHGSKSVLVLNAIEAQEAGGLAVTEEFLVDAGDWERMRRYGPLAARLRVALHEVLGHASGRADPKLEGDPSAHLREYYNTLEEARADLVMLWHAKDPAMAGLGLAEPEEVLRTLYAGVAVGALTNLLAVREGDRQVLDHLRARHLIANWLLEAGALRRLVQDGKTYVRVTDTERMHEAVGVLLSRLMTLKATGDRAALQALVEKYGAPIDPVLRDEVVRRADALEVPDVRVMGSPRLRPVLDAKGALVDVVATHEHAFLVQHLERSLLGRARPEDATRLAARLTGTLEGLREAWRAVGW